MSKSFICKCLIEADAQVASEELCAFEPKPERMMHLEASEVEELQAEPDFKKARQDMASLYRDARKNVDKYGGFCLFNKTGKRIKPRLQPLDDPVACRRRSRLSCRDRCPISLSSWAPVCRRRNMCCSGHSGRGPPTHCTSLAAHTAWFKKIFANRFSL